MTHSPILMAFPDARIFLLDAHGIQTVEYTNTEHYAVTKRFLQDPASMLRDLFARIDRDDQ